MAIHEGFRTTRLLYYEDAYLKEFTAKVLATPPTDRQERIVLDQTAFYPVGGGQPSDTGKIRGAKGEALITDAHMEKGAVIHVARVEGTITSGETVTGVIDWNRRYNLMRNHTLAHLMAEAIRKATGLSSEVVSSGLDVNKARLDLAHSGSLGSFVPDIQKVADDIIKENRPVEIKTMQRKEAEEYVVRFHESLKTLPPQVEKVRVVEVRNWHACACGGIHVRSTGEIEQAEILRRTSKGKGVERIEFRAKMY